MPTKKKLVEEVAEVMATGLEDIADKEFDGTLLGDGSVDTHEPTDTEQPEETTVATVGAMVQSLLMDPALDYEAIVARVMLAHPSARTTVRSVASTASVMRKKGTAVPLRSRRSA